MANFLGILNTQTYISSYNNETTNLKVFFAHIFNIQIINLSFSLANLFLFRFLI